MNVVALIISLLVFAMFLTYIVLDLKQDQEDRLEVAEIKGKQTLQNEALLSLLSEQNLIKDRLKEIESNLNEKEADLQ